jgi:hypothetical protein
MAGTGRNDGHIQDFKLSLRAVIPIPKLIELPSSETRIGRSSIDPWAGWFQRKPVLPIILSYTVS